MKCISVLAVVGAVLLTACVYQQHGTRFDVEQVKALQPGSSTEQDAIARLGKPSAISTMPDGTKLLQWHFVYGTAIGVGGGAHAAVLFDSSGKMVRVIHLSEP